MSQSVRAASRVSAALSTRRCSAWHTSAKRLGGGEEGQPGGRGGDVKDQPGIVGVCGGRM